MIKVQSMPQAIYSGMITLSFGYKRLISSMVILLSSRSQGRFNATEK
jgi:hypothetical protein